MSQDKTKEEIKKLSEQTYKETQQSKTSKPHAPSWTYGFQQGYIKCQSQPETQVGDDEIEAESLEHLVLNQNIEIERLKKQLASLQSQLEDKDKEIDVQNQTIYNIRELLRVKCQQTSALQSEITKLREGILNVVEKINSNCVFSIVNSLDSLLTTPQDNPPTAEGQGFV